MAARSPRSFNDCLMCGVRSAKFYIVFDGIVKQINILKYDTHQLHQFIRFNIFHIFATNQNSPFLNIPKPCNQIAQSCFTRARWPYNSSYTSFRNFQRNVLNNRTLIIPERYILKFNVVILYFIYGFITGHFGNMQYGFHLLKRIINDS